MNDNNQEIFSQQVLRDMNDAVLVLDRQGRVLYINQPASDMLEIDLNYTPGQTRFFMVCRKRYYLTGKESICREKEVYGEE